MARAGPSFRVAGVDPTDVPVIAAMNHVDAPVLLVAEHQHRAAGQFHLHHRVAHRQGRHAGFHFRDDDGLQALIVLFVIYTLNFLDRQVVSILAEPIKNDLKLADWQLGLMTGFAFAFLYTLLGLPIARSLLASAGGELELLDTPSGTVFRLTLPAAP